MASEAGRKASTPAGFPPADFGRLQESIAEIAALPPLGGYVYAEQRARLFTERGSLTLSAMREATRVLIAEAGAVRAQEAMGATLKMLGAADTWEMLAALDRLVEVRVLHEVATYCWAQHRVFVAA